MHKAFKSSFKNLGLVPSSSPELEKEDIARLIVLCSPGKNTQCKKLQEITVTQSKTFTFRHFRKKETEKSMPFLQISSKNLKNLSYFLLQNQRVS